MPEVRSNTRIIEAIHSSVKFHKGNPSQEGTYRERTYVDQWHVMVGWSLGLPPESFEYLHKVNPQNRGEHLLKISISPHLKTGSTGTASFVSAA